MSRYALSPEARDDLKRIEEEIAKANPARALSFLEELIGVLELLSTMPRMGRERQEFGAPRLRSIAHGDYIVFYRPAEHGVDVLRVLHGRRNLGALL